MEAQGKHTMLSDTLPETQSDKDAERLNWKRRGKNKAKLNIVIIKESLVPLTAAWGFFIA